MRVFLLLADLPHHGSVQAPSRLNLDLRYLFAFFWLSAGRARLEMLNLSHNRLSSIVGLSSLPALIALNLGKSIPAFCHLLRSRDLEADATLTASLLMKVAAGLVVLVS